MPIEFRRLGHEEERALRTVVANTSGLQVADPNLWVMAGAPLTFYQNVWLCFVAESHRPEVQARRYFLARFRRNKRAGTSIQLYLPLANRAGLIAKANRRLRVKLNKENVIDYLNFYYQFTPQDDPLLRNMNRGPTQFSVPLAFGDLAFDAASQQSSKSEAEPCSAACLARGAAWRFLDEATHQRTIPIKFRKREAVPRVSGRVLIQFQDALFAADFRVPLSTGVPVLSNPDLLYQHPSLEWPERNSPVPMPGAAGAREVIDDLKVVAIGTIKRFSARFLVAFSWAMAVLMAGTWFASALFPILEILGYPWLKDALGSLAKHTRLSGWPQVLVALTGIGVVLFLGSVIYTTHMDKIFNLIFALCPKRWRERIAPYLNSRVDRRDRDLNAQDTFHKRALWAIGNFLWWTGYLVLAFASLQLAINTGEMLLRMSGSRDLASPLLIVGALLVQAVLNIPLVYYLMSQIPVLASYVELPEGLIHGGLLAGFHIAIALVVLKGIHRVWVLTVEASPHAFYRRLRYKGEPPEPRGRRRKSEP